MGKDNYYWAGKDISYLKPDAKGLLLAGKRDIYDWLGKDMYYLKPDGKGPLLLDWE